MTLNSAQLSQLMIATVERLSTQAEMRSIYEDAVAKHKQLISECVGVIAVNRELRSQQRQLLEAFQAILVRSRSTLGS